MRILHTGDWHVGKRLRGESRLAEHEAVLAELVELADDKQADLVIVAGDLFDSAAPPPDAQAVVWRTLMDLRATGAHVVVIAGNHDNAHALEALRPVLAAAGVTLAGHARGPDDGGVVELETRSGDGARLALLPFLSQRYVVKAAELMAAGTAASDHALVYADRMRRVVDALTAGFEGDAVNVAVAHCFVRGGTLGGGERDAHTIEDYWIDATAFPASAHYVALGHLHRTQQIPGPAPVWYSGSPIQVDFGEERDTKHVLLVDVTPTTPAKVTPVPLRRGWRLATVEGTLEQLRALAASGEFDDAFLRIRVREPSRVGLADEVRTLLPRAVDVRIEREHDDGMATGPANARRHGRGAHELFAEYLASRDVDDPALTALFAELYEQETAEAFT